MKRNEVEAKIYEKMQEIVTLCKKYDENFNYLALAYIDGDIFFNNRYWETDKTINFFICKGGEEE